MTTIDHVAVLTRDVPAAVEHFEALGFTVVREFALDELGVSGAFLAGDGASQLELYTLHDRDRLEEQLAGRAMRLDHIALRTTEFDAALATLGGTMRGPGSAAPVTEPVVLGGARQAWIDGEVVLQLIG